MVDRMMFCSICGGPVRPPIPSVGGRWADDIEWQTRVVLLSDPAAEFEALEQHYFAGKRKITKQIDRKFDVDIRCVRATATWANLYVEEESGREIVPNWLGGYDEFGQAHRDSYSIAAHEQCVDIASLVMRKSSNDVHVRSMRTLWKVLRTRFDARDNEYMGTVEEIGPQYVTMNHGYYMPLGFADDYSVWEGDDKHWVVADPTYIPDLTRLILSNIKHSEAQAQSTFPGSTAFGDSFLALPQELQDRVVWFMGSFEGLSVQCTGLLPQETWLRILLNGRCLPFLWDLDTKAIEEFHQAKVTEGAQLDWELLVRKLSKGVWSNWKHHDTFEADFELFCYPEMNVPRGLQNRRRIWQLVEEMRVGDVMPVRRSWVDSKQLPSMPRYWDEYGDPVFPVVRVTGLLEDS